MLYHFAHKASKDSSFSQLQTEVSILDDLFTWDDPSDQSSELEGFSINSQYNRSRGEISLFRMLLYLS